MFYSQSIVQFTARRSHLILAQTFLLAVLFFYTGESADASPHPYLDAVSFDQQSIPPSTISGTVWNDLNNNGIHDQIEGVLEPFLVGAEVRLENTMTGDIEQTTQTGQNGEYSFEIHEGIYRLEIEALGGFSAENVPPDIQTAIVRTDPFTLYMDTKLDYHPIGLQAMGALGGRIWDDENFDGMQSDNETGLPDIAVELVQDDSVIESVQSDVDGRYLFQNLPTAAYVIQIVRPEEYRFSPQNPAIDDQHNSDVNPELGRTASINDLFNFSIDIGLNVTPPEHATPTITSTPVIAVTPTLMYTDTPMPTHTSTASPEYTATPTSTSTPVVTATPTLMYTDTPMPTHTSTASPEYTATPIITDTPTIAVTPTVTPTDTPTPTYTPIITPTAAPESTPTITYTPAITVTPMITVTPTLTYTETPTSTMTPEVTATPTITVTPMITVTPTLTYTETPTSTMTPEVTATPAITVTPTITVTPSPTYTGTPMPTATPTPASAEISGRVWMDQDRDGLWDEDIEQTKSDIWVGLYLEDQPNSVVSSTTTTVSGTYAFTNLPPDNYYLQVGIPAGYELSPPNRVDGQVGSSVVSRFELDGHTNTITLVTGEVEASWNVGLMETLSEMVPQITRVDYVALTEPVIVCGTDFLTDGGLEPVVIIELEELLRPLDELTATIENTYPDGDVTCLETRLPEYLPAGLYTIKIKNANDQVGTRRYALTILPNDDDFYPIITKFTPTQHRAHQTNTIEFYGHVFQENITLEIGGIVLTPTVHRGDTYLEFVIGANRLPPGIYDLILENPGEGPTSLPNAYTILQSQPYISSFSPKKIYQNSETVIDIFGDSFSSDITLYLQNEQISQTLPITYVNSAYIQALLPKSMPTGDYRFVIADRDGNTTEITGQLVTIYDDTPQVFSISPTYGRSDVHNKIHLYGRNLMTGTEVSVGEYVVSEVDYQSDNHIQINIPSDALQTRSEKYDIQVTDPQTGKVGLLSDAYIVLPADTKDLYSHDNDLSTRPHIPYVNEQVQVGLNVRLRGGQQRVNNVQVAFVINSSTGETVQTGTDPIINLNPSGSELAEIQWNPSTDGTYTIIATIDPEDTIEEEIESNNVITQTFTVLPQRPDMVAPRVDDLMVNNIPEIQSITEPEITLQISASDIVVQGSETITEENGIASIYIQELKYDNNIGTWVPIKDSDWQDYQHVMDMDWKLDDSSGLKAFQVWASDWAGNVSLFPYKMTTNYEPPTNFVGQNESQIYSREFAKDECVRVNMTTEYGDPDLYVWPPGELRGTPPWVNNNEGEENSKLAFLAPVDGVYAVEVYGYVKSAYRLDVTHEFEDGSCIVTENGNNNDEKEDLAAPASLDLGSRVFVPPPPTDGGRGPDNSFNVFLPYLSR